MYDGIVVRGVLNAMLVNGDGIRLNAHDSKRACAVRQERLVYVSVYLLRTLIFGRKREGQSRNVFLPVL